MWLTLEAYKDDPIPILLFENVPRIASRGRAFLDEIIQLHKAYGYLAAETVHDCGEIGNLGQSRKRFLLVMRHAAKVPPFLYQPEKFPLRGVGEIIGKLPMPGDGRAGPMHRVPMLQWKTWVRLAFVPAGKDWRALNDLAVEGGVLRDYGIMPERELHGHSLGVCGWDDPAPTITSARAPGQGRYSVADPRPEDADWQSDVLGVRGWHQPTGTVPGRSSPTNGAHSVADPRVDGTSQIGAARRSAVGPAGRLREGRCVGRHRALCRFRSPHRRPAAVQQCVPDRAVRGALACCCRTRRRGWRHSRGGSSST
jgi:site-specific DNA-cytosine methylase